MRKDSKVSIIGNYTKNAVENFEHNIISQKNYMEKVESNRNANT